MSDETFIDPEDTSDGWVDVRMTDPEEGEWDIDLVVVDGQVNYVDLRIRPKHLTAFVACLIDDVGDDQAGELLRAMADQRGLELQPRRDDAE
jgi:hypothetical protein